MIRPSSQQQEWFEDGPLDEEELELDSFDDLESALEYLLEQD